MAPRRRPWRRWVALAIVLVLAVTGVLLAKAASYQPLGYGDTSVLTLDYPGLPAAHGARAVNTFGLVRQDVYIPPQPKGYTFYLFADIRNNGSRAVTIESVGLPPDDGLTPAGPARYAPPASLGDGSAGVPPASTVVRDVTLRPGGEILAAIPARSWPCFTKFEGFDTVPSFDVTYRFGFFTRTTALPWNMRGGELILHAPHGQQGQAGVACV